MIRVYQANQPAWTIKPDAVPEVRQPCFLFTMSTTQLCPESFLCFRAGCAAQVPPAVCALLEGPVL